MATSKPSEPAEGLEPPVPAEGEGSTTSAEEAEQEPAGEAPDKPKRGRGKAPAKKEEPPAGGPNPFAGLVEGRIVHYVLPKGLCKGKHRAAIVSLVQAHGGGLVNLQVILNGNVEFLGHEHPGNLWLVENVLWSPDPDVLGTWHWIERE